MIECPYCGHLNKKSYCYRCHRHIPDLNFDAVIWIFVKNFFKRNNNQFVKIRRLIAELKRYNIIIKSQKLIQILKRVPGEMEVNHTSRKSEWRLKNL